MSRLDEIADELYRRVAIDREGRVSVEIDGAKLHIQPRRFATRGPDPPGVVVTRIEAEILIPACPPLLRKPVEEKHWPIVATREGFAWIVRHTSDLAIATRGRAMMDHLPPDS